MSNHIMEGVVHSASELHTVQTQTTDNQQHVAIFCNI